MALRMDLKSVDLMEETLVERRDAEGVDRKVDNLAVKMVSFWAGKKVVKSDFSKVETKEQMWES
jgi:hypothetical protein